MAVCMLGLLGATLPCASRASTIAMQVTCGVVETNLVILLVNKGDESGHNVVTEVAFLDSLHHVPPSDRLDPGDPLVASFAIEDHNLTGIYPAVVTVRFEDSNAYPFSSVTVHPVAFGAARVPCIFGTLESATLRKKRDLILRVRNHSATDRSVRCRVVTAGELSANMQQEVVTLSANELRVLRIALEDLCVLPGSTYPVYVLMEYDEDGEHFCAIASTTVDVARSLPFHSWGFWVLLLLAGGGIGFAVFRSRTE